MTSDDVPTSRYEAADWLANRHPWVRELVQRITGPIDDHEDWLDTLGQAVNDSATDAAAWAEYERLHPAPSDEAAYDRWQADGPQASAGAQAFGVMSSGEKNLVRLVATLSDRVPWSIQDVSFDRRGAAVLADWLAVVRAQLPEWMYTGEDDPFAAFRGTAQ